MRKRNFIFVILIGSLLLVGCSITKTTQENIKLNSSFFPDVDKGELIKFVGMPKLIKVSEYDSEICSGVCLHPVDWYVYEIRGYFPPDFSYQQTILVAHKFSGELINNIPWQATLKKFDDVVTKEKLGADYLLAGVELGFVIFCPESSDLKLYDQSDADFIDIKTRTKCFSL